MGTIYLSKAGSDANAGTSISLPKLTLDSAYTAAVDGDSICFFDPWGIWQEDWSALGYIQLNKASMTTGIHFWSFFPDRPAMIGGVSGAFSVRIATSGHRFSNIDIISGSTSNTTIFGCSTGTVMDNIRLRNVRVRNIHDIDSSSAYMVQLAGAGVHTGWSLVDCTLDAGPSTVINGINTGTSNGVRLHRVKCNLPRFGGGYSLRIGAGSQLVLVEECELDGNYGILQDTAAASQDIIIVRSKIRGRTYAASFGGTSSGTCRIFMRDTKVYGDGLGIAGQSNITFDAEGLDCISDNVALGMPTDGAYSDTRALLHGCKSSTHGIGGSGHALLFGVGSVNAVVKRHYACSRRSGWGVVMKGTGGLLEDSDIVGGPMSTLYFKGANAWTVNRCSIVQDVGGSAIEVKNGDTTPLSSDLKITNSAFTVTDGELFDFGAGTHEDGTSQVDYNRYRVVASGTWGNVRGTTVNSLADVRTAWDAYAVPTNDELSVVDAREMLISDYTVPPTADQVADEVETRQLILHPDYDAAKTAAQPGDDMGLATADFNALVAAIEVEILNDGTGGAVIQTIADAVAAYFDNAGVDLPPQVIAAAVRTNLATELARIDVAISTRLATAGYTAPLDAAATRNALGMLGPTYDMDMLALLNEIDANEGKLDALDALVQSIPTNAEMANVLTMGTRFLTMIQLSSGSIYQYTTDAVENAPAGGGGGGGGGDVNVISVNGLPVDTGQINITVVNSSTVQKGTLVLYREADYTLVNDNPIHFSDVANIDGADELYLTIVNNSTEAAIFTRKESAAFDELAESADFEATAAELAVESGAHYAFVVERKVGTEYNPILIGPCTIKDNNRTF